MLELLQSFDLHHDVKSSFFLSVLSFERLLFFKLLVSDSYTLGIDHHLVHLLHFVDLLIKLMFGLSQDSLGLLLSFLVGLSSSLLVESLHLGLSSLGVCHLLVLLFRKEFLSLLLLLLSSDLGRSLDSLEFSSRDDNSVNLFTRLSLLSNLSNFAH